VGPCPVLGVSENYLLPIQGKFVINLTGQFEETGLVLGNLEGVAGQTVSKR
jgi:hypothetical protein